MGVELPQRRRAGRGDRRARRSSRTTSGHVFAVDLRQRQDALAVRVVPQPGDSPRCRSRPRCSTRAVRDPRLGRSRLEPGPRHQGPELSWPPSAWSAGGPTTARSSGNRPTCPTTPGSTWSASRSWPTGSCSSRPRRQANPQQQRQGQPQQFVLAIRPHDGKLLWKAEVGIFRQGEQMYYYYGMRDTSPQPRLVYRAGVGLRRHARRGPRPARRRVRRRWTGATATRPTPSSRRAASSSTTTSPRSPDAGGSQPLAAGDALLIKGVQVGPALRDRPEPDEGPLGPPDRQVGAPARRRRPAPSTSAAPSSAPWTCKTRKLLLGDARCRAAARTAGCWCGPTASGSSRPGASSRSTRRSGAVRRIFRGEDPGSAGGDLILTDRWLLAISNRTISAYPRGPAGADGLARRGLGDHAGRGGRMTRSDIAVIVLSLVAGPGRRRVPGPGPVLPTQGARRARRTSRASPSSGKGRSSAKPEPAGDRPGGLGLLGADRRRDRQVPRRQEAAPGRLRRAQARQRRRRGARPARRPEGADATPTTSTASPTARPRPRSSSRGSSSSRRPTSARWTRKPCSSSSAKLLDVAQDAGGKVGGRHDINPYYYYDSACNQTTGLVRFVLDDYDKLQEEAYEKAIADARARAERLARLSGVELGPVAGGPRGRRARREADGDASTMPRRRRDAPQAAGDRRGSRRSRCGSSCWSGSTSDPKADGKAEGPMNVRADAIDRRSVASRPPRLPDALPSGLAALGRGRLARRARPRPGRGEGGPAQARHARDAPGRDQGAGLPRRASRPTTARGSPAAARPTRSP